MEWIEKYFEEKDNFPRPIWEGIYTHADATKDTDQHELWCEIARIWMRKVISKLTGNYVIHESDNFILVASESDKYVSLFQNKRK